MAPETETKLREAFRRREVLLLEAPDSPKNAELRRSLGVSGAEYVRVQQDEIGLTQSRGQGQVFNPFSARAPEPAASAITVHPS